ncbi:putative mitogen-activated protein kinase kinase 2 STE-STE7 family [Arabidopsis thaliana]
MKKGGFSNNLKLAIPVAGEQSITKFLRKGFGSLCRTQSGTFKDGDLRVNKDGVRIISQLEPEVLSPIKPADDQLSLSDLDMVKVIGKGSSGVVQLVQHKWTGQFFALKVIQLNIDEAIRKAIAQELKINQSSQCPNLVTSYQSFYDNGAISLILEYMDGGSLADFLKSVKAIPDSYLSAIFRQVLQGLIYLHHDRHIIHRDLKPSNLLINHRGEVKITDFGVSTVMTNTAGLANTFVGTYNYMSPERIVGNKYGNKSDIWSLGLVVLECATGKFPYAPPNQEETWTSVFELMEAIVDQPPPALPSGNFSPELSSFISTCLQKEPNSRSSAKELMEHPFLNKYDYSGINLASYFTDAGSPLATLGNLSGTFSV